MNAQPSGMLHSPEARANWHEAMRNARRDRYMARCAMPASLRPTFALLARCSVSSAQHIRIWAF